MPGVLVTTVGLGMVRIDGVLHRLPHGMPDVIIKHGEPLRMVFGSTTVMHRTACAMGCCDVITPVKELRIAHSWEEAVALGYVVPA